MKPRLVVLLAIALALSGCATTEEQQEFNDVVGKLTELLGLIGQMVQMSR